MGSSPVITAAIHDGHDIRKELRPYLNLTEHDRMRQEDPYTGYLADISDSHIIVHTSRFEVDLNRTREKAVYRNPEDAWGMSVWKWDLPGEQIKKSLGIYDEFYKNVRSLIHHAIDRYGYFIILDLHSYNYRTENAYAGYPSVLNPEVNLGTAFMTPAWRTIAQIFTQSFSRHLVAGHHPEIREDIKSKGGEFSRWVNRNFGDFGCSLSVELKKNFMDEWTGRGDIYHLNEIKEALQATIPELLAHRLELVSSSR